MDKENLLRRIDNGINVQRGLDDLTFLLRSELPSHNPYMPIDKQDADEVLSDEDPITGAIINFEE